MKVYENLIIGNFLYGLGFAIRGYMNQKTPLPGMVNLLQQTPVDPELADVLLNFPGTVRLLEFKMVDGDKRKEQDRHQLLTLAMEGENQDMINTSRNVHWYIEVSSTPDAPARITRVVPYLDAFTQTVHAGPNQLEDLIDQTARQAVQGSSPQMHIRAKSYLDFVRLTFRNKQIDAGGLLIVVDGQSGRIDFAQLRDILDLNLPYGMWLEQKPREHTIERPGKVLEHQHEIRKPGYQPGMRR